MRMQRFVAAAGAILSLLVMASATVSAQVRYAPYPEAVYPFGVPYDETYSGGYSFEIQPYAPGGPAVRVVQRCAYPNGWNVTDFSRDVNGIPAGIDHVCPGDAVRRARTRY